MALADLLVRIGVDASAFIGGMKDVNATATSALDATVSKIDAATTRAAQSAAKFTKATAAQQDEIKNLGKQFSEGAISADQFLASVGKTVNLSKNATEAAKLETEIGRLTKRFESGRLGITEYQAKLGALVQSQNVASQSVAKSFDFAKAGGSLQTLGAGLSAIVSAPLIGLGVASVRAAADLDSLTRGLNAVNKSGKPTAEVLKDLREVAKLPGLGFQEAVRGSINLQAAGFSAQLAEKSLRAFGNALATVGKGKADLDGVTLALSQIASKGKISAEEINQLAERVPQIREAIKAAFGTADTEALQKAGISATQFVEKVTTELLKLPQVTGGIGNAFENLSDSANPAFAKIGQSLLPAVEAIVNGLSSLFGAATQAAEVFSTLPGFVQGAIIAFAAFAAGIPIAIVALGTLAANLTAITTAVEVFTGVKAASLAAGGALRVAALAASAVPYVALAVGIGAATTALLSTRSAVDNVTRAQQEQAQAVTNLTAKYQDAIAAQVSYGGVVNQGGRLAGEAFNNLRNFAFTVGQSGTAARTTTQQLQDLAKSFNPATGNAAAFIAQVGKLVNLSPQSTSLAKLREEVNQANEAFLKSPETGLGRYIAAVGALKSAQEAAAKKTSEHKNEYFGFNAAMIQAAIATERQNLKIGEQTEFIRRAAQALAEFESGVQTGRGRFLADVGPAFESLRGELSALEGAIQSQNENLIVTAAAIKENRSRTDATLANLFSRIDFSELDRQANVIISQVEQKERNKGLDSYLKSLGTQFKKTGDAGKKAMQQVSLAFTQTTRGITEAIFEGGKFGERMVNVAKEIGKGFTQVALESIGRMIFQLKSVQKLAIDVVGALFGGAAKNGISNLLGGVAGSVGGSVVSSTVGSAVGSTAGSAIGGAAGSAAGSGAGAAVGGAVGASLTGIVGAVGSAVGAVSSIFGNFQMAAINKVLDLIEVEVRKTANDLGNLRRDEFIRKDEWFTKMDSLFQFTWVKLDDIVNAVRATPSGVSAAAGGGGNTINFALSAFVAPGGEAQFFDWIATEMRRRRIAF